MFDQVALTLFASTLEWAQKAAAKTSIMEATAKLVFLRMLASDWGRMSSRECNLRHMGATPCDLDHS